MKIKITRILRKNTYAVTTSKKYYRLENSKKISKETALNNDDDNYYTIVLDLDCKQNNVSKTKL